MPGSNVPDQAGSTLADATVVLGHIAEHMEGIADSNERARQESGRSQATADAIVQAVRTMSEAHDAEASARDERAGEASARNEASMKATITHQAEAAVEKLT